MRIFVISLLALLFNHTLQAQQTLKGKIVNQDKEPLVGAAVFWENSDIGTFADTAGYFEIKRLEGAEMRHLEIGYVGYNNVLIPVGPEEDNLEIEISGVITTEEAQVLGRKPGHFFSSIHTQSTEIINSEELRKAACCNLSECFETNNAVSVGQADAATGAKEIELLGLRGIYVNLVVENKPQLQGLAAAYNLEFIPGPWLENIQVAKGASGVVNGPRAITGQINVELKKPTSEKELLYINLYGSHIGRAEFNGNFTKKFGKRASFNILSHVNYFQNEIDHNHDGFIDVPKKLQINVMPRLFWSLPKWEGQFYVHGVYDDRKSGQFSSEHQHHPGQLYQIGYDTRRLEAILKTGYIGFEDKHKSLGIQTSAAIHSVGAYFGQRRYDGLQHNFYTNVIYDTHLFGDKNILRLGGGMNIDNYQEKLDNLNLDRLEMMPGAFAEYTYNYTKPEASYATFGVVAGLRADYLHISNENAIKSPGLFFTPRLNLKYSPDEKTAIRLSAGSGLRSPTVLAENISIMPTQKSISIESSLPTEYAWNYGVNVSRNYSIGKRDGSISVDFFHTNFERQVIIDQYSNPSNISIYALDGKSYSNSFIVTVIQEIVPNLELKVGYKYNDVMQNYNGRMEQRPLLPRHRGMANLFYKPKKGGWEFSTTLQWLGPQLLSPVFGPVGDLPEYRSNRKTPSFALLQAQVTKTFKNGLEFYIGAENLNNYRQEEPIIGWQNPFGGDAAIPQFDAGQVYGPIMGVMVYGGMRYTLKPGFHLENVTIKTSTRCTMCKKTIEEALSNLPGIEFAGVHLGNSTVEVRFNKRKVSLQQIKEAISKSGYQADDLPADKAAYDELPSCCKH